MFRAGSGIAPGDRVRRMEEEAGGGRWVELGVLDRICAALIEEREELGGVDWESQAADGAMGKARFGGISSVQTSPTGARTG